MRSAVYCSTRSRSFTRALLGRLFVGYRVQGTRVQEDPTKKQITTLSKTIQKLAKNGVGVPEVVGTVQ